MLILYIIWMGPVGFIFSLQHLHAGGPWLVYKAVIDGQGSIFPLNLAYDNGPQFAFTEQDLGRGSESQIQSEDKKDLEAYLRWGQHFER